MRILALDPGWTTGHCSINWAGARPGPADLDGWGQVPFPEMPYWLSDELAYGRPDIIIIERFNISERTVQFTRQLEALYVIGGVIFMAELAGTLKVRMQNAADAKTAYPSDRLKREGWPVTGPHAKDALRHALLATHAKDVYGVLTQTQT